MADWPATLPALLLEGYTLQDDLPVIRTPFETGLPRITQISDVYVTTLTVAFLATAQQLQTYRNFLSGLAKFGAQLITMPLVTTQGVADHDVHIVSSSIQRAGRYWRIQMTLETTEHIAQ